MSRYILISQSYFLFFLVQDFVDSNRSKNLEQMRDYVAQMLMDIKNAHKSREEQLSQAAQGFKKRMTDVAKQHETLLKFYMWIFAFLSIVLNIWIWYIYEIW